MKKAHEQALVTLLLRCTDAESLLSGILHNVPDSHPHRSAYHESSRILREATIEMYLLKVKLDLGVPAVTTSRILRCLEHIYGIYAELESVVARDAPYPRRIDELARTLRIPVRFGALEPLQHTPYKQRARLQPTAPMLDAFVSCILIEKINWEEIFDELNKRFALVRGTTRITRGVVSAWARDIYRRRHPGRNTASVDETLIAVLQDHAERLGGSLSAQDARIRLARWRAAVERKARLKRAARVGTMPKRLFE